MNKHRVALGTVTLVLFLGVLTPHFAQNVPGGPEEPDQQRRQHALSLLRAINTVEVVEAINFGSFASWQTLLAHQPNSFDKFFEINYPRERDMHFADMPEILPGWSLRFNVHADGKGYDARLQDLTDKTCGYAALTDESGVIRQSKAICEIQ